MRSLVLASTSAWRKELLARLKLPFDCVSPELDERPWMEGASSPEQLVIELAEAKARAAAKRASLTDHLVLGADQVAEVAGTILGKPGTPERAVEQLGLLAGRSHRLLTGLALLDTASGTLRTHLDIEVLHMRPLSLEERRNYVAREDVLGCAGSYRIEGLGITLFSSLEVPDWTGVVGLPLMATSHLLRDAGVDPLASLS